MSTKISAVISKNSHEVIRVITNHYKKCSEGPRCCQYNNKGAD
jgi:hypothetical protein